MKCVECGVYDVGFIVTFSYYDLTGQDENPMSITACFCKKCWNRTENPFKELKELLMDLKDKVE